MNKIERIPEFIAALKKLDDAAKLDTKEGIASYRKLVNSLCKKEVKYLRENSTLTGLRGFRTRYRNAIRKIPNFPKVGKNAEHTAIKYFNLNKAEKELYVDQEKTRKDSYLSGETRLIICDFKKMLKIANNLLESDSAYDLAAGLLLVTGRRATEIFKTATFKVVEKNKVLFCGQLKNTYLGEKTKKARDCYEIFTLVDSEKVIRALTSLRGKKDLSNETEQRVNSLTSNALGKAVKRSFDGMGFIKKPLDNQSVEHLIDAKHSIQPKDMRSIYVHIAHHLFAPLALLPNFGTEMLGHVGNDTVDNYMEYMLNPVD